MNSTRINNREFFFFFWKYQSTLQIKGIIIKNKTLYSVHICAFILFRAKVNNAISRQTHPALLSPVFPIFKMKKKLEWAGNACK